MNLLIDNDPQMELMKMTIYKFYNIPLVLYKNINWSN